MLFWTVAMLMALMALMAVLVALLRSGRPENSSLDCNLRVYRRQLLEIDLELSKNAIGEAEAEQSRQEISRRMLRVSRGGADPGRDDAPRTATIGGRGADTPSPGSGIGRRLPQGRFAGISRPTVGVAHRVSPAGLCRKAVAGRVPGPAARRIRNGSAEDTPGTTSQATPTGRDGAASPDRPEPIASLRRQLDDALDLGDLNRAVSVQRRIIDRLGNDAPNEDRLRLAELYVVTAGGRVSPEAEAELVAVLERNPEQPRARYFIGLLALQVGRPDQALATWVDILRESEPDDGLRAIIARDLPVVADLAGFDLRRLGDGIALPDPSTGMPNPVPTAPDAN